MNTDTAVVPTSADGITNELPEIDAYIYDTTDATAEKFRSFLEMPSFKLSPSGDRALSLLLAAREAARVSEHATDLLIEELEANPELEWIRNGSVTARSAKAKRNPRGTDGRQGSQAPTGRNSLWSRFRSFLGSR